MTLIQRCTFPQPAKVNKKRQLSRTTELAQPRNTFKRDANPVLKHVITNFLLVLFQINTMNNKKTSINCD